MPGRHSSLSHVWGHRAVWLASLLTLAALVAPAGAAALPASPLLEPGAVEEPLVEQDIQTPAGAEAEAVVLSNGAGDPSELEPQAKTEFDQLASEAAEQAASTAVAAVESADASAAAAGGLASCASHQVRGNVGYIYAQTDIGGRFHWGAAMYRPSWNWGPWVVDVRRYQHRVDFKRQMYAPHGSVPPSSAPSGSVMHVGAVHVFWWFGFRTAVGLLSCRMP